MWGFWVKRALLLLIGVSCLAGMFAANGFVYGPVMEKLNMHEWHVLNLLRCGASCLLFLFASYAFIACVFLPRPSRRRGQERLEANAPHPDLSATAQLRSGRKNGESAKETGARAIWLAYAKRVGLMLLGIAFLGIMMFMPWGSWTYSRFAPRYGKAGATVLHASAVLLLLFLFVAGLRCILVALDLKRRRPKREESRSPGIRGHPR
jgi:hypothetical protein